MKKKIIYDLLFTISVSILVIFIYLAISKSNPKYHWGTSIFVIFTLLTAGKRFENTIFRANEELGLTDCYSLDDVENWFNTILIVLLFPLIPIDLVIRILIQIRYKFMEKSTRKLATN